MNVSPFMQALADSIIDAMHTHIDQPMCFILLAFPTGKRDGINIVGNIPPLEMIAVMKHQIKQLEEAAEEGRFHYRPGPEEGPLQ